MLGFAPAALAKPAIGVIIPLTGPAGSMGASVEGGLRLAAPKNLELRFEDNQCDNNKTLAAYHKLSDQGVKVFLMACSGGILATAPLVKARGQLIVTPYAGSAEIRNTGTEVIRFNPDGLAVGEAMLRDLHQAGKEKRYALLYEEQDYAVSLAKILKEGLPDQIVSEMTYLPTETSFATLLIRLRRPEISAILFIPVSDTAARVVLKQIRDLGIDKPIIGEVNLCDYPFRLADIGLRGECYAASMEGKKYEDFMARYERLIGRKSQYPFFDAIGYDVIKILDRAAGNNNFAVPELTRYILQGVEGELMSYRFTPNGEVIDGWRSLKRRVE
jgi:branched-chain amino acid transport system substrate-binding protein